MRKFPKIFIVTLILCLSLSACKEESSSKEAGIKALNDGDYETAIKDFDKALSESNFIVTDEEIDISYYKACAEYLSNDKASAEETFTNLIDFDNKNPDAYYLRGCLYLIETELDKAKKDFDKAIELKPDDFKRYLKIYEALSGVSNEAEGEEYLKKAIAINGKSGEDYLNRGKIYSILGQDDVAEQAYTKALNKGVDEANLFLAMLYDSENLPDKANEALDKFIKSGKETAETDSEVSAFYIKRGDYKTALSYIEKGLKLNDTVSTQSLKKNYIILLEYEGDFDSAYKEASEYIKSYPFDTVMTREYTFLSSRANVEGE